MILKIINFCDFSRKTMLDIALRSHDHAIIEKEPNVFTEMKLENISNKA